MKVHRFLPAFEGRRIVKTAVLVHVHALESARACSKTDSGMPGAPKDARRSKSLQNLKQEVENSVWNMYVERQESA